MEKKEGRGGEEGGGGSGIDRWVPAVQVLNEDLHHLAPGEVVLDNLHLHQTVLNRQLQPQHLKYTHHLVW
ncbi:unnamed protein product [Malus baccata var. baccata]